MVSLKQERNVEGMIHYSPLRKSAGVARAVMAKTRKARIESFMLVMRFRGM